MGCFRSMARYIFLISGDSVLICEWQFIQMLADGMLADLLLYTRSVAVCAVNLVLAGVQLVREGNGLSGLIALSQANSHYALH